MKPSNEVEGLMGLTVPVPWIGKACEQDEEGTKETFCKRMKLDKVRNNMIG